MCFSSKRGDDKEMDGSPNVTHKTLLKPRMPRRGLFTCTSNAHLASISCDPHVLVSRLLSPLCSQQHRHQGGSLLVISFHTVPDLLAAPRYTISARSTAPWRFWFLCTPTAFFLEDAGRHPGRCAHLRRFGLEDVNPI